MAIFSFSSSSKGSSDETTLLPTYEQSQSTPSEASVTLPSETATPEQVREFLVQLLIAKRSFSDAHACRIASEWKLAGGKELRTYGPSWYRDFFGRGEEGLIVFKEVKTLVYQRELDERKAKIILMWIRTSESIQRHALYRETDWFPNFLTVAIALITLACDGLLVCAMALGFQANDNRVMGAMAAIPAFLLVSIVGMIGVTVSYEHIDTVESRVEGEIERYWA
jgi:hypothetical protein